ncbi:STAS domain protein [Fusobacterium gonidiaformans 3-1-5R]|uniref:Anti-sigma factor antagonist n=2 Tax=Fusobacterium TaxID=848 RepID=E5BGH4_9FUSO|nr:MULTISPECIES: anti-sigma factor antagonist [Fusobacterium]AVQ16701.1 anti-sigma factor antagonist [Fusobacterium gonidiaformans ATCC 25563]EFS21597.1 STAS domain protein [Fusobacterium gonidiaformans 3-1-5R]EFS28275.1 anti-anti-sigma factor [Fusobacterium gonidiaformans ATCC 25563]KXA13476.1 STAS domain protein [Fusobacterium equinum]
MENTFELTERKLENGITVIGVMGELDALVAPKLKELMNRHIDMGNIKLILDCENLVHINSLAMGILRGKLQSVKEIGGDIKIIRLNNHIQTIFDMIGLDEIFEIYATEEEAVVSFR